MTTALTWLLWALVAAAGIYVLFYGVVFLIFFIGLILAMFD